jgi:hypothetical protein
MEMDFVDSLPVDAGFGFSHFAKDAQTRCLDRIIQGAPLDKGLDIGEIPVRAMFVPVSVRMRMVPMVVVMGMIAHGGGVSVVMARRPMLEHNVHPDAENPVAGIDGDVQLECMVQSEFGELDPQMLGINAEADHGGQIHVAADSGKTVVKEYFHRSMHSLSMK